MTAGIVDTAHGYVRRETREDGVHVLSGDLPEIVVTGLSVRIGTRKVSLARRRWLFVVAGPWPVRTVLDDVGYALTPRGMRLAELRRNRQTLAVLARPRRSDPIVRWTDRAGDGLTVDEVALGHAMALVAGF